MNYEFSNLEWKLCPDQLEKGFLFFHDIQHFKCNNYPEDKQKTLGLEIKITAYKTITHEFKDFFSKELFRIKTAFADHRIKDSPEKFNRYFNINYEGLLRLKENYRADKPRNIDFNSASFLNDYEKLAINCIKYDLQKRFIKPLLKSIKQEFAGDLILSKPNLLPQKSSRQHFTRNNTKSKLKWRGPVNKLVTIFYELTNSELIDGKPVLAATPAEISDLILNSFVDNNGNDFSNHTVRTILQPGRTDKRSPEHKKYNIPS